MNFHSIWIARLNYDKYFHQFHFNEKNKQKQAAALTRVTSSNLNTAIELGEIESP